MKTPEQIATDVLVRWFRSADDHRTMPQVVAEAINADRAQRAELLTREARALGFYRTHALDMVRPEGFIDGDGERYDSGALLHNMGRAREAMLLVAGVEPTEAFRGAFA